MLLFPHYTAVTSHERHGDLSHRVTLKLDWFHNILVIQETFLSFEIQGLYYKDQM